MTEQWLSDYPVLLVDDEPANLLVLKAELSSKFTLLTARSGDEALDLLRHNNIAVVITDQRMPGMTGSELCARIREEQPHVHCLIITAYGDFRSAIDAINRANVDAYLVKPWNATELRARLLEAISSIRVQQMGRQLMNALHSRARLLTGSLAGRKLNHDMRSVIGAGQLATDILSKTIEEQRADIPRELGDELRELTQHLGTAFKYLESLRRQASNLGVEERNPQRVKVLHLLEAMEPLLPVAPDVTLRIIAAPDAIVEVDRVAVTRIFINLVENACREMHGEGMIVVVANTEGNQVIIDVKDVGPGVPVALRDRVFELRFSTRQGDGESGFGLSISRELARREGGDLQLLDTMPPGATFRLRLPAARSDRDAPVLKSA